jgi:signal transduction histidine kinase
VTIDGVTASSSASTPRPYRRLYRRADQRVFGGVAAGIAEHLRVPRIAVRLAFCVLLAAGGLGAVLYAVFWAVLPRDTATPAAPPSRDMGQLIAFGSLVVGALVMVEQLGLAGHPGVVWPAVVIVVGAGVTWQRSDAAQRQRFTEWTSHIPALGVVAGGRFQAGVRFVVGGLLVVVGVVGFFVGSGQFTAVRQGLLFSTVLLAGVGVVAGPWFWRTATELRSERTERIRSQARADIAAVVHDQVLHTLALIQRNADDSREVARLARGQERELRNWLYKPGASPDETLVAALESAAAEVEDTFAVVIDVVIVGDGPLDDRLVALVQATREALVNAAKHAGVETVSLYAEIEPEVVTVFVRDRGRGFDPSTVDTDRHGVSGSIVERMDRYGGEAEIRTAPGAGTEVRLTMKRVA